MTEIIRSTEDTLSDGERRAERDLGELTARLEHLAERVEEHSTTIEGLRQDRTWFTERIEAIVRDFEALPRVPGEVFTEAISDLTSRMERLENSIAHDEPTTEPPERHEHHEERESDEGDHREEEKERRKDRSLLDRLF